MLLPYLGGAPSVWTTCIVFFQGMLLGGYAYAHLTTKWLGARRQIVLHLVLLLSAVFFFPPEVSESVVQSLDGQTQPIWWLLVRLSVMVGLPFLMLSTGGPLLQQWFSSTNHVSAKDPYFLYSASNLGSLVALLGYPILMEPVLRLHQQAWLWAGGYVLLLVLIFACALVRWRGVNPSIESMGPLANDMAKVEGLTLKRRVRWLLLAFVPSSLMLGVTTYLSTDISSVPLLWVIPLSLYLLTFILAFARRQLLSLNLLTRLMPMLSLILILSMLVSLRRPMWLMMLLHLLFFFVASAVCHRRLADDRPPASKLTEFYLWLSFGGVLGGIFNSVVAPAVFNSVVEYPLAIVLALLVRPRAGKQLSGVGRAEPARLHGLDFAAPVIVFVLIGGLVLLLPRLGLVPIKVLLLSLLASSGISYLFARNPLRFGLAMGALMLGISLFPGLHDEQSLHIDRNFFGVLRVARESDGKFQQLYHGTTLHGRQFLNPQRQCEPLSYYHQSGPLGQALEAFAISPALPNIAVVGLGTGAMASYSRPGQIWTFYEIDPAVLEIAQNSQYFTYLQKCTTTPVKMVLGDARLQLRSASDGHYGLIVLDAFSSDAIPLHLLTREALDLYLSKLAPGGWLAFHISNRHLDLHPVVGNLARSANLICLANKRLPVNEGEGQSLAFWVVLARLPEDLGNLLNDSRWQRLEGSAQADVWTDDYSNILKVLKWKF
ncbi:MAG: fused MFS/spermidine synthase [Acidobacteria bacterium]|nr:fused MFS/spermidine synthase [Acidobacteriota bacterium]